MSQIKVSSIMDLTGAKGFNLGGGGIMTVGTLTVSNLVINGELYGDSNYIIPAQGGNADRYIKSNGTSLEWAEAAGAVSYTHLTLPTKA